MQKQKDIFDHLKPRENHIPDQGYFDQLAKNVIASTKPKVIPLYKKPLFWISTAAASVAVILLLNFEPSTRDSQNILVAMNDIPKDEVLAYVKKNIKEFDLEMLGNIIPAQNIEAISSFSEVIINKEEVRPEEEINFDNIQQDDILKYLQQEDLDISDLEDLNEFND